MAPLFIFLLFLNYLLFTCSITLNGGQDATGLANSPGSGAVLIDNGPGTKAQQVCTGALLSELLVLTNGRCYDPENPPMRTTVIVGTTTPFENGIMHYVIAGKFLGDVSLRAYQLAVLMLDRRVYINAYARPYALPANHDVIDHKHQFYHAYGYGTVFERDPDNYIRGTDWRKNPNSSLMRIELREEPIGGCERIYGRSDGKETKLRCFGKPGHPTARLTLADNGAPLVGSTDHVMVAMACVNYDVNFQGVENQRLHYHIDIQQMRWRILEAMKELMQKNPVEL